jgi:hypothetical protein
LANSWVFLFPNFNEITFGGEPYNTEIFIKSLLNQQIPAEMLETSK